MQTALCHLGPTPLLFNTGDLSDLQDLENFKHIDIENNTNITGNHPLRGFLPQLQENQGRFAEQAT